MTLLKKKKKEKKIKQFELNIEIFNVNEKNEEENVLFNC